MLIVATAGHIDHGKTSLVHALTGVDTDRLPEERARGISIDLGFAYGEAAPGELVAFVDVPGHHRFIRNMLAGVAAIDFALLVVAVDDGPMPQTVEHIQILDFLGVSQGVVALSKADLVHAARVAEVRTAVQGLLEGTTLSSLPSLAVSARSGEGIAELKALLAQAAGAHEREAAAKRSGMRRPRFAIDRAFSVRGAGTVVTGTMYDGELACDDRVAIHPGGEALRVRGIQVHGREVARVGAGERAALNLAGAKLPEFARGDWLAPPGIAAGGAIMDVQVTIPRTAPALAHGMRVRLHLGASEVPCRVLLPGRAQAQAGRAALARLHLDAPVLAVNGDRFVLRDASGVSTLAGGVVVDPSP
ncbi:MAG: hypothetical protein K0R58_1851, partial [Ramlibacter sp.]|nr:hypothetical protein [Ramlibacter sp.]